MKKKSITPNKQWKGGITIAQKRSQRACQKHRTFEIMAVRLTVLTKRNVLCVTVIYYFCDIQFLATLSLFDAVGCSGDVR